jgi:hypothetical protein
MVEIDLEGRNVYFRKVQIERDYYSSRIKEDETQPVIVGKIISAHKCRCGKVVQVQALVQDNLGDVKDYKGSGENLDGIAVNGGVALLDQDHSCKMGKIFFDSQELIQYCWSKIYSMGTYVNEDEIPKLESINPATFVNLPGISQVDDLIGNSPPIWLFESEAFLKKFYKTNYWATEKEREKAKTKFQSLLIFQKIDPKITVIDDTQKLKVNPKSKSAKACIKSVSSVQSVDRFMKEPIYIEQTELF